jgi:DNA-binding CsgD family transcriptional regulator
MGFVLCRSLIGRDAEVAQLTAALERSGSGDGRVLFLAGEPGVGKSRLAREVLETAARSGVATFAGRASESAVQVPYRPLSEALMRAAREGLTPVGRGVARYRPALGRLVPEWGEAGADGAEVSGVIVAEGVLRLLSGLGPAGALLVLEDLQWADPETLTVLEFLAGNVVGEPVLCLATVRDSEPSAGLDLVRGLAARKAADLVVVPRLGDADVRTMAADCLGTDDVPDPVARLLSQSDGLPFAVEELLAAAAASGLPGDPAAAESAGGQEPAGGVPVSIGISVTRRLAACGPAVTDVLSWAAVLGAQFDPVLLPALAGVADSEVQAALAEAQQAMLIKPADGAGGLLRFRHSLTRRAVLAGLLPPDRAARAARAAGAVEAAHPGLPGACCELAADLYAAAGARDRAAALMLEVGQRALRQGALGTASAALAAARDLAGQADEVSPDLGPDLDLLQFETFAATGDRPQILAAADRLVASLDESGPDPPARARILIMTARARHLNDPDAAAGQLTAGRKIAARLRDSALVSEANVALAQCALDAGDIAGAGDLARTALAAAQSASPAGWSAGVAIQSLQVLGATAKARDLNAARAAFRRSYQIADDHDNVLGRIEALSQLGTIEMLENGTGRYLQRGSELAHAAGAISAGALIDIKVALLAAVTGDLDRAHATARQCEADAARIRAGRARALSIAVQAFASAARGERAAAEAAARRAEEILPGNPEILFTTYGLVRVTAALFCDDLGAALRHAAEAAAYSKRGPPRAPSMASALYPIVHVLSGRPEVAALDRTKETAAAVKWNRGFFACAEAVLAGRSGRRREAAALADEGQALLSPFAPQWTHLARQLISGPALLDHWGQPVRWLNESAGGFDATGLHELAAACRRTLHEAGQPVPRPRGDHADVPAHLRDLGITAREMDVYRLLARGMANSQIAGRLEISPKTVDTHVASLIAKTGRTCLRELVAHAARQVPAEDPLRQRPARPNAG